MDYYSHSYALFNKKRRRDIYKFISLIWKLSHDGEMEL
jgi:hypothetical protein